MFDIGWQELFVVAAVTIVVIGPKELPRTLRAVYGLVRKGRMMAREFQDGLDEVVRHADLEDIKAELERTRKELKATEERVAEDSRDVLGALEREQDELKTIMAPAAGAATQLPADTVAASLPMPVNADQEPSATQDPPQVKPLPPASPAGGDGEPSAPAGGAHVSPDQRRTNG